MTTPQPALSGGQTTVATDSAALRRVGEAMHAHAAALQKATKALSLLPPSADAAAGQFIAHHAPKDVYKGAAGSLKALSDKFQTEADHAARSLTEKADALRAAATSHDATEDKNATTVHHLPTETFTI